ncbi:MAG: metal-dependent hydrolase [Candidatus Bathyarchaeota archaeon]|nr:metal-dependent hydrolase [Candidatus Bathyarchaeota archaeon A05DMB-5]MDH7557780.1 metal-dependent hydrolase [Candidatus Bathyarchaeota archaeon]
MAKVTWFGHAAFKIEIANKIVLVDPWLDGNPTSPVKASEITKADIVYVTHDHGDHLGDAINICKRTGATFVANIELGDFAKENGVKTVEGLNIGGNVEVKGIRLLVTQALHTDSRGAPTGVIIEGEGKRVYHAGDTGLFGDMSLIGELYKPDLALIPIGGYYTMGAKEAAEAVKMLKPKAVIPMHYKTFPVLAQSAGEFAKIVKEKVPKVKVVTLKPGESYQF